jgi:hypothetical protein
MTYDEEPPEELVRERIYLRRRRMIARIDPRDPRYDDRFDPEPCGAPDCAGAECGCMAEPMTKREIEEIRVDREEHDPDSPYFRRPR